LLIHVGSDGYTNVRSSPKVDNESWARLDFKTNLLGKINNNPVGAIQKKLTGEDGYHWFEIELDKPLMGQTTGYVREDAITIQK